jgi:hypothetical protein
MATRFISRSATLLSMARQPATIADMKPTWCMEIRYRLRSSDGEPVPGVIHNTIHRLGEITGP